MTLEREDELQCCVRLQSAQGEGKCQAQVPNFVLPEKGVEVRATNVSTKGNTGVLL